ncbi:hypothetical protein CR513_52377, partial [Mucuna pruriens]
MDGFSGYNQIRMALEDKEKATFIITWGTFCYKVMLFRLKNARATYQRAMVTLFHDMMHKEVKVYVDNMVAKSRMPNQHVNDLRKLFERLWKYKLRLNPAKCTFGVKTRKLLGFIVNERGIEVNLDKVKAIRDMPASKTETEPHIQAPLEKSKDGVESRVPGGLQESQAIPEDAPRSCPDGTQKTPDPLFISVGRVNGWYLGATRCFREGTGHLLSQQEIHGL